MLKSLFSVFLVLFSFQVQALSLLQETKEIVCQSASQKVIIDKKDRYFDIDGERYNLVEFLDSAILAKSQTTNEFALLQITPKETATLIKGSIYNYVEKDCDQVSAHKVCTKNGIVLEWSPTSLKLNSMAYPVVHYGVYPNDGTFFIAQENGQGAVLIDFGSKFSVVNGEQSSLDCSYL